MKIGDSFQLNGVKWTIKCLDDADKSSGALASSSVKDCRINLFGTDTKEKSITINELCHEVTHSILDSNIIMMGDEIKLDEHFIQIMANGMQQFIQAVLEWQK